MNIEIHTIKANLSLIMAILSFVLISTSSEAQRIDTILLPTSKGKLEGSFHTPMDKDSFPALLIIAGSGPTDRNGNNMSMVNNAYQMLADSLVKYGIASLRYDKRGIGRSVQAMISEDKLRFEDYVNDAVEWIHFLDSLPSVREVIVFGHSEGSLLGILAAQKTPTDKYISMAGAARPIHKIIRKQLEDQPASFTEMALPILDSLEKGHLVNDIPAQMYVLFRPSIQPYLLSWFKYNPVEEIGQLEVPILIVQGTTDIQVDAAEAKQLAAGHPEADLLIIEGMNHIMKTAPADRGKNLKTYNDPDLPLHQDFIPPLVEFIKEK